MLFLLLIFAFLSNLVNCLSNQESVVLSRLKNNAVYKYSANPATVSHILKLVDHGTRYHVDGEARLARLPNPASASGCSLIPIFATSDKEMLTTGGTGAPEGYCATTPACGATTPLNIYYSRPFQGDMVIWNEDSGYLLRSFGQYRKKSTLCYAWPRY